MVAVVHPDIIFLMQILIAPNAFKYSLTADAVAEAIEQGLKQSSLHCSTRCFPIGDGGDGTAALLLQHMNGKSTGIDVHDPLGRTVRAPLGLADKGQTAVIEMADASGLRLLRTEEYDPLYTSSRGTGELIRYALDLHVQRIILGIGGSATVDGAAGILQALGMRFLDKNGDELTSMPDRLSELAVLDDSKIDKRIYAVTCIVMCDVDNLLLGERGAAAVFGPQKGADAKAVKKLESGLQQFRDVVREKTGLDMGTIKHGGAAGGVAAAMAVLLNAQLVHGIEYFLDITGFDKTLEQADMLITGEGSMDAQTLDGKGPFGVARRAKKKGLPVVAMAGRVPLENDPRLCEFFDVLLPIQQQPATLPEAMKNTYPNLIRTSRILGDLLAMGEAAFRK